MGTLNIEHGIQDVGANNQERGSEVGGQELRVGEYWVPGTRSLEIQGARIWKILGAKSSGTLKTRSQEL